MKKTPSVFAGFFTVITIFLTVFSVSAFATDPGMTLSKTTLSVTEAGTSTTFTLALTSQPTGSVTFSVTNPAPTQMSVTPLFLTFTGDNWSTPQTVTVTATNDTKVDGNTPVVVVLSVLDATSDDAFDSVPDSTVNVTVVDDDSCSLTITESNGTTMVTEAGTTDIFTVKLGSEPTSSVVATVTSSDVGEVTVNKASLTFTTANWNTTQTVTATGVDDAIGDGNQTTPIVLAINDAVSDNCFDSAEDVSVSVAVSDDDSAGLTVAVAGGTIAVTEKNIAATATTVGNTDTFTVVLNNQPTTDVVISISSSDTGELSVSPASLTFTNADWSSAQTVTVKGVDDNSLDGTQSSTITISVLDASSDNTYDSQADIMLTGTTDDDDAVVATTSTTTTTTTLPPVTTNTTPVVIVPTGPSCEAGPKVDCAGADFAGKNLFYADFQGADLRNTNFASAVLFNADMSKADMTEADMSNAKLNSAFLYGTNLGYSNFHAADLKNAALPYAHLVGAEMIAIEADKAEFIRADMRNTDLRFANLTNVNLGAVNLEGADLTGANLTGASLIDANLTDVNFYGANLTNTDLTGVNLRRANLYSATTTGAFMNDAGPSRGKLSLSNIEGATRYWMMRAGSNVSSANLDNRYFYMRNGKRGDL